VPPHTGIYTEQLGTGLGLRMQPVVGHTALLRYICVILPRGFPLWGAPASPHAAVAAVLEGHGGQNEGAGRRQLQHCGSRQARGANR